MNSNHIEHRDGGYFVTGSRVSLDSIVYAYLRGDSPEGIAESFPVLSSEQIIAALDYYAANRDAVNHYLAEGRADFEALRREWQQTHPSLHAKLAEAKQRSHTPSGA